MALFRAVAFWTQYRKRPFGNNAGLPCCVSPSDRSTVVRRVGDPPVAGTCQTPCDDPNRILPSSVHAAPRGGAGSQTTTGDPPATSTRHNLASAHQPTDLLSGDQNGNLAVSLLVNTRSADPSSGCSHSPSLPFTVARKVT